VSLGRVAIGLASIAIGLKHLSSGVQQVNAARRDPRGPRGPVKRTPARRVPMPPPRMPQPNDQIGYVQTPSGRMRMRTFGHPQRRMPLDERIKHLRAHVEQGKRDPTVYEFARRAVNGKCGNKWCVPEKDNLAEIKALFDAIRKNVRYTSDIRGIDTYQSPAHTLRLKTADCDDYSTLVCAAAETLGIPCRFKVIRTLQANDFDHIYAQVGYPRKNPTRWISMDASVDMPCGWEAPARMVAATRVFPT